LAALGGRENPRQDALAMSFDGFTDTGDFTKVNAGS
jgi:hypothetical protein